ncbi:hypothetical protein ACJX0J_038891, partial [Zea mays]
WAAKLILGKYHNNQKFEENRSHFRPIFLLGWISWKRDKLLLLIICLLGFLKAQQVLTVLVFLLVHFSFLTHTPCKKNSWGMARVQAFGIMLYLLFLWKTKIKFTQKITREKETSKSINHLFFECFNNAYAGKENNLFLFGFLNIMLTIIYSQFLCGRSARYWSTTWYYLVLLGSVFNLPQRPNNIYIYIYIVTIENLLKVRIVIKTSRANPNIINIIISQAQLVGDQNFANENVMEAQALRLMYPELFPIKLQNTVGTPTLDSSSNAPLTMFEVIEPSNTAIECSKLGSQCHYSNTTTGKEGHFLNWISEQAITCCPQAVLRRASERAMLFFVYACICSLSNIKFTRYSGCQKPEKTKPLSNKYRFSLKKSHLLFSTTPELIFRGNDQR